RRQFSPAVRAAAVHLACQQPGTVVSLAPQSSAATVSAASPPALVPPSLPEQSVLSEAVVSQPQQAPASSLCSGHQGLPPSVTLGSAPSEPGVRSERAPVPMSQTVKTASPGSPGVQTGVSDGKLEASPSPTLAAPPASSTSKAPPPGQGV